MTFRPQVDGLIWNPLTVDIISTLAAADDRGGEESIHGFTCRVPAWKNKLLAIKTVRLVGFFFGGCHTTQLYRDYFISQNKIPIDQPGFQWNDTIILITAHL